MRCIFCDFVQGKIKEHKKGFPFIVTHETENTVSFLSIDSPVNNEAHMLVIPKEHYSSLHEIPKEVLKELINHTSLIGRYYSKKKSSYNLLLNNGKYAGQFVPHSHFHVIPRKKKDNIKIEVWKRHKTSGEEFVNLSLKTRNEFSRLLT